MQPSQDVIPVKRSAEPGTIGALSRGEVDVETTLSSFRTDCGAAAWTDPESSASAAPKVRSIDFAKHGKRGLTPAADIWMPDHARTLPRPAVRHDGSVRQMMRLASLSSFRARPKADDPEPASHGTCSPSSAFPHPPSALRSWLGAGAPSGKTLGGDTHTLAPALEAN